LVDIGVELSGEPSALVLDSPFNSVPYIKQIGMAHSLRTIAKSGVTVITVLEQPRYEILCCFDDLILIGRGGKVVYNGPTRDCLKYFLEIGFKCPSHINPTDLFYDIMDGNVERPGDVEFTKDKLPELWISKQLESDKPWSSNKEDQVDEDAEKKKQFASKHLKNKKRRVLNKITQQNKFKTFFGQYILFTLRSFVQLYYHSTEIFLELLFTILTASVIGALFLNMEFIFPIAPNLQLLCPYFMTTTCSLPRSNSIPIIQLASIIGFSIVSLFSCDKIFGNDKVQLKKEVRSGINKLSYYLGKLTAHLPFTFLFSLIYISVLYIYIAPRANFGLYFLIYLLINYCWTGFGYFFTLIFSKEHGLFIGSVYVLFSSILSGYNPFLSILESGWYYVTFIVVSLSPMRYALELLYVTELSFYYPGFPTEPTALIQYGFRSYTVALDVVMLLFFGFFFRLIAFITLYFQDPKFQSLLVYILRFGWRKLKDCWKKSKKKKKLSLEESILLVEKNDSGQNNDQFGGQHGDIDPEQEKEFDEEDNYDLPDDYENYDEYQDENFVSDDRVKLE